MSNSRFRLVAAAGIAILGLLGSVLWIQVGLDGRLRQIETRAGASSEPHKPMIAVLAPNATAGRSRTDGPRLAALEERLRALEARLEHVPAPLVATTSVARESTPEPPLARPSAGSDASATVAVESHEAAAQAGEAQLTAYRNWLTVEIEQLPEVAGLTEEQRESAVAAVREVLDARKGRTPESIDWPEVQRQWKERLFALMTADQRRRFEEHQTRQEAQRVDLCAHWAIAALDEACRFDANQRTRVRSRVREYYQTMRTSSAAAGNAGAGTAALSGLREAIASELQADQLPGLEEWLKTCGGGAAGPATEEN